MRLIYIKWYLQIGPQGEFSGETTHKVDYGPKQAQRPENFKPPTSVGQSGPFEGNTTHISDYRPWKAEVRYGMGRADYL